MESKLANVKLINHPLIAHKLTHIRQQKTNSKEFKEFLHEITQLMAYEVLRNLKLKEISIQTPLSKTTGYTLNQKINLYPILRAGLGMVEGFATLIPNSQVGHIGLYRDEVTLKPVEYLFKYPKETDKDTYNIVIDPMIATGGSADMAINILKQKQIKNIKFVALLASRPGIETVSKNHPDVLFYVASIDPKLDKNAYIVPGLGDAGDRIFGTK